MDIVQKKFDNFKVFLTREVSDSYWMSFVTSAPLDVFLKGIHGQGQGTAEEITDKILSVAGLSREGFSAESVDKFQRYIEYFQLVARQMYD